MDVSDSIVHLGIQTDITGKVYIEGRIDLRRKSVYSLMGAGFHWGNGLKGYCTGFQHALESLEMNGIVLS